MRAKGDREYKNTKKASAPVRRNDEAYNRRKTNSLNNPIIIPQKKGLGRIWNGTKNKDDSIPAYGANFSSSVEKPLAILKSKKKIVEKEAQKIETIDIAHDSKFHQIQWTVIGKPEVAAAEEAADADKLESKWNLASDPNLKHVQKAAEEIAAKKAKEAERKAKAVSL